ncbi:MAG: IclR family transcriptional regulator [Granulosicoccaceae bacterium]
MNPDSESTNRLPTNMRLLLILEAFANSQNALTPTEVNASLKLPKQSIHRLCQTLIESGFLIRDVDPKRLRPARRARMMANGIFSNSHLHIARRQVLQKLAQQVGETVNFVVAESEGMVYTDRVDTDWPLRFQLPIGSHVPFHCTASGKVFMASINRTARIKLVKALSLESRATNTITDPASLLEELHRVEKQGYALDNEEFMEGMVAAAVPVNDLNGKFCAAIAFHAPCQRVHLEAARAQIETLQAAAQRLSDLSFS